MNWKFWQKPVVEEKPIEWPKPYAIKVIEEREQLVLYTIDILLQDGTAFTFDLEDELTVYNHTVELAPRWLARMHYENKLSTEDAKKYKNEYLVSREYSTVENKKTEAEDYLNFSPDECYKFKLDKKEYSINGSLIKHIKLTQKNTRIVYTKYNIEVKE